MKDWKDVCKRIFILPLWQVFILTVISAVSLVYVFINGYTTHPFAYVSYVISFYSLTVLCIVCYKTVPGCYRSIRKKVYANKYANRYLTDVAYKTHVNIYLSLGINLLYVATNAVSAIIYNTRWFAIFAVYYSIMAIMKFILARYIRKNNIGERMLEELKKARVCAGVLLTVNLTLSGVVLMMVYHNRGFEYQGFLIYVMAVYTFYATISAIVHLVKYRKYNSPVLSVTKIIKLASSLFSMLFLETAMFSQFGQETPDEVKRIMIMATGAGISVLLVGISVYMIVSSSRKIKNRNVRPD